MHQSYSTILTDPNCLCQHYLHIVYQELKKENPSSVHARVLSESYGEILYASVHKLLTFVVLSEQDIFADLGSGAGKVAAQVFLSSPVREAIGIEIRPEFHKQAILASERIYRELACFYEGDRKLTYLLGSFFECSFSNATVVFLNSTCYTQTMLDALGDLIEAQSSIRAVYSLRPLNTLQRLSIKKAIRIECSWDSALCYFYE